MRDLSALPASRPGADGHWARASARRLARSRRGLLVAVAAGCLLSVSWFFHGAVPRLSVPPHPIGWLVGLTAAAIAGSYLCAAVALRAAAGRPLPWLPTVLTQLAAALANRLVPAGLGGIGVNLRYLSKAGLSPPTAGLAVGLVALGNGLSTLLVAAAVAPFAATSIHVGHLLPIAAVGLGVLAVGAAIAFGTRRRLPARVRTQLHDTTQAAAALRHHPGRLALVLTGCLGFKLSHIAALLTALAAFGSDLHAPVVIAVYLAGSAAASAVPTPNGLGAVEAALISGLLAAGGPLTVVVAGVLVFRLASFWMPILPGLAATSVLRRRHAI